MLGGVLGGVALSFVVLTLVPITLDLEVGAAGPRGRLRWAFGLVAFDPFARTSRREGAPAARGADRTRSRPRRPLHVLHALAQQGLAGTVARFVRRLARATHARGVELRAVVDLGDPADTGMLWAILGPVAAFLRRGRWGSVELEPGFAGLGSWLRGRAHFTIVPAQVIVIVLGLVLSWPTLRAGRALLLR